jgi:hypothetical protein
MLTPQAAAILETLQQGTITIKGRFLWGSNYTFLAEVEHEASKLQAVYKPSRGERPLWDFPTASLAHREVAAYLVNRAMGFNMVPETVYRRKGPMGAGSLQRYIEHDPEEHYFNFGKTEQTNLRAVALFDLLVNNADRKGGHVLRDEAGQIWLIDHGLCFHVEDKLRTVIWDFAGEPIPPELLKAVGMIQEQLAPDCPLAVELADHLSRGELRALGRRANWLLVNGIYPAPQEDHRPYPWPPL